MLPVITLVVVSLMWIISCGNTGDGAISDGTNYEGGRADVKGAVLGQFGGQAQMAGWIIAAVERDYNIARVAEVNENGLFELKQVFIDRPYTLALLSPNYIVSSVLSLPSEIDLTIKQFFNFRSTVMPTIIDRGKVINFQTFNGIEPVNDLASDQDGDGKPDGVQSLSLALGDTQRRSTLALTNDPGDIADVDLDGTVNNKDPDIDGDGVINVFDSDDDGDAIFDIFDIDANGDNEADFNQSNTDMFFKEGIEWLTVQYELDYEDANTAVASLTFSAKLYPNTQPFQVQIRGSQSLLNGSTYNVTDSSGIATETEWDRLLHDDGKSEDGGAGDRLFAQKIKLQSGKKPKSNQAVFFQLAFGSSNNAWFLEYPFTFPSVSVSGITAQYDANTRIVQLIGNPFGAIQDFIWLVNIYNESGQKIYGSDPQQGTSRTTTIPDNILESGTTYTYKVVAQVLDKVPGYSSFVTYSPPYTIE